MSQELEKFNLSEITSDKKQYFEVKEKIKKRFAEDYSLRKNKVCVIIDGKEREKSLGRLLTNILIMKPLVYMGVPIKEEDWFEKSDMTQGSLEDYFNHLLERIVEFGKDPDYSNTRKLFTESMNEMTDLSGNYNATVGNSVSYRDFLRMEIEDPEAEKLFKPEVKAGSFHDIETQFNAHSKKLVKYLREHKDSELNPFIRSETGINGKQLTQCIGFIGLKPDMDGSVIPVIIEDNFLNGLSGIESYFINAKGTRKALCTNNRMTKRSGYLTRKLSLSNIDHFHDDSVEDCGTRHFVIFSVDNKRKLNQIVGRHYYKLDENNEKISDDLYTVTDESSEIIGTKIGLRSPVTCAGKHVCATCYGRQLSRINKDVNTGLVATNKLTEPLTQRLLSAKHLLSTKTDKVEWGENFGEVFSVNMNTVYFIQDVDCTISFAKPTSEEFDEDEEMYYTDTFNILMPGNKRSVEYKSPVRLFINPKLLPVDKMKDDDNEISFQSKSIDDGEFIFKYQVKNTELTQSLQAILDLIENTDHLGITDYNDFVNKFDDLLIENDLDYINSIHIEMISAVLIRDAETGKRLDFSNEKLNNYNIVRLSKSVMDGPLAVSLAFERINDQLSDLSTYEKDEVSMMDNLFL